MIRVLLAGFAGIGGQDHQSAMYRPALAAHGGFAIAGVCPSGEVDARTAARTAEELRVPLLSTLDAGLADPAIDVVSAAMPLPQRADATIACLRAGKHVLADKPLAGTFAEVTAILAAARDASRVLLPAHHHRWNAIVRSVCRTLAAGKVGLPWNVQADFLVAGGQLATSGELDNFALYPLDVIRALLGLDAVRVHALAGRHWHEPPAGVPLDAAPQDGACRPAEDLATLLVDYRNGVTATITVGRTAELHDLRPGAMLRHRYRVSGSHGTLVADATRPGLAVRSRTEARTAWTGAGTVAGLVAELHRAVGTGTAPIGHDEILDVYRTVAAARQSLHSGRPCEVG